MNPPSDPLPDDILKEIFPRLSQETLARVRAVCTKWKRVIEPLLDAKQLEKLGAYEHRMTLARDEAWALWIAAEMEDDETANQALERFRAEGYSDFVSDFERSVGELGYLRKDDNIGEKKKDEILGRGAPASGSGSGSGSGSA